MKRDAKPYTDPYLAGIGSPAKPHKVQAAFIEEQVPQCGYCLNGWIMTTVALLENPRCDLGPRREAQLHEDVLDMPFGGPLRDHHSPGDDS